MGWFKAKDQDAASDPEQLAISQRYGLMGAKSLGFNECSVLAATVGDGDRIVVSAHRDLGMQFGNGTICCEK